MENMINKNYPAVATATLLLEMSRDNYPFFASHFLPKDDFFGGLAKDFCDQVIRNKSFYESEKARISDMLVQHAGMELNEPSNRFISLQAAKNMLKKVAEDEGGPVAYFSHQY